MLSSLTSRHRLATRSLVALAVFTAAGFTAAGAQVRINLRAWQEPVLLDTLRQNHDLKAPADVVYQAVLRAYADLGIPTGRTDGKTGVIGSERFERVNSLAGAPLSRSFDCGETTTGPVADSYRLEIAVVAWVTPQHPGSTLGLATIASGRDISGVFVRPRPSQSTGALEGKILDRVTKIVGG